MPIEHRTIPLGQIHIVPNWEVANAAALAALTPAAGDIGKFAWQTDLDLFYVLKSNVGPVWKQVPNLSTDVTLANATDTEVSSTHALKTYIDAAAAGLTPKLPVQVKTTTALPAGTYNNGAAGVGATFTVTATGTLTIDSHLTALNDRVEVANQADATQNGVYKVTTAGAVGVQAVLTRATDSDTGANLLNASYEVLLGGQQGTFWYVTNASAPVIGTDNITFAQFTPAGGGGGGGIKVGSGLQKNGNTISASYGTGANNVAQGNDARFTQIARNHQVGTTYTFVLADGVPETTIVEGDNASAITFTVPPHSSVAFPVNTIIGVMQVNTGQITIVGGAGVTVEGDGNLSTAAQWAPLWLWQRTQDEWILTGDNGIANNSITVAMLAQAAAKTLLGNPTGSTANIQATTAPVVSGEMTASDFNASGLTGAVQASRYVGATASGAPASGTFAVGDFIIAQNGHIFVCTVAGTPGTWVDVGSVGNLVTSVFTRTGAVVAANGDYNGVVASALTGATAATRYVGGTASVAPASGTFAVGDFVISQTGHVFICTVAGTPGTWVDAGSVGNLVTSVFGRTGAVVAANDDYAVTNLAAVTAKSILGNTSASSGRPAASTAPVVSGEMTASDFNASGLTGATAASRYCGATTTGAPASGTFAVGDFVIDQKGLVWVCISAGTPGTWFPVGPTLLENHQTGTSYTTVLTDAGKILNCDNGSAFTLTFDSNANVAYPVGTQIDIYNGGAGQVTVALTSDTLHAPNGTKLAKQYSRATMWKQAATVWVLSGDTSS